MLTRCWLTALSPDHLLIMRIQGQAFLLQLLLAALLATGQEDYINGEKGGEIVLQPLLSLEEEIVWKKGVNKVAELENGKLHVYPAYKARFKVDNSSGKLTITNLMEEDAGDYYADILISKDNRYQTEKFPLRVFPPLNKPSVTCREEKGFVILTCNATSSASEEYTWKHSNGEVVSTTDIYQLLDDNKTLNISLAKEHPEKSMVCVVKSPASEKTESIFISECLTKPTPSLKIGLAVSLTLIVIAALVVGVLYYKGYFNRCRKVSIDADTVAEGGDNANLKSERRKASKEEEIVMKNSADEQKAFLSNNEQKDDDTVHSAMLNNDQSSPRKARGDGPQ
ncbi:lymphocyte function-associated antigen 3 isoform X2 [Microcaecilia unicolor]|uniref:Lymphocyte function-associated antigen 3 isoform X2 n=1 Tax=Microcaecilia unicolor TaxID=1415580 RepID=A0A6P7Y3Q1_9AMPH|nr:lymphocyte function-associated antigen 3 isoform X2 [Microcaecilia unicolor]